MGSTSLQVRPLRIVDCILFNDELSLLRYRFRLHAPFVSHFVVVESNVTFSYPQRSKELTARVSLSEEEVARFNVRFVTMPPIPRFGDRLHPRKRPAWGYGLDR